MNTKILFVIVFFFALIVGCNRNQSDNPLIPDNTSKNNEKSFAKTGEARMTHQFSINPDMQSLIDKKRIEMGIKIDPYMKPTKSEIIDLSKYPNIVLPSIAEVEKMSPKRGVYFSGHNYKNINCNLNNEAISKKKLNYYTGAKSLLTTIVLDYYSWCYPFPNEDKPIFYAMGSASTSSVFLEMDILSFHYLNNVSQDYWEAYCADTNSLATPSCCHNTPLDPFLFNIWGWHYFYHEKSPYLESEDWTYAEGGTL
jgi:hypothetical protein